MEGTDACRGCRLESNKNGGAIWDENSLSIAKGLQVSRIIQDHWLLIAFLPGDFYEQQLAQIELHGPLKVTWENSSCHNVTIWVCFKVSFPVYPGDVGRPRFRHAQRFSPTSVLDTRDT